MTPKQLLRLTIALLAASVTVPAVAAPNKDAATLKKIDEAVNVHYIAAQFDKAESVLLSAIKACGAKLCSGEVIAKAYIYVGVIRGNGKGDIAGARQAFENAQAADPNVTLDPTLVTPAVLAEFNKVMGKESDSATPKADKGTNTESPEAIEVEETKDPKQARVAPVGELRCSPATGYEIQTARPVPVHCERKEGAVRGELYYKPVGSEEYTAMLMKFDTNNATLRAQVPCDALARKGTLNVYVIAQNENKDMVDTFGNDLSPVQYSVVDKTKAAAPSYPGESPPKRCTDVVEDESGAGPGEACTTVKPCRKGNYCSSGICRKTPTCDADADCESDHCADGLCEMKQEFADKPKFNRWRVGLNFAADLWLSSSAKSVCGGANAANGDYNCYNAGSTKINTDPNELTRTNVIPMADPAWGGNIKSTLVPATFRALVSVDYALNPTLTVGARLGFAFNGGPATIHYTNGAPSQNKNFFPAHAELRAAYWFKPLDVAGFHPYAGLSAGMAEVDAKVTVTAWYNAPATDTCPRTGGRCARKLDAWRKLGRGFAGVNFGGLYDLTAHHSLQLNVNAMYMLPASGIVLEPSLGYVFGF